MYLPTALRIYLTPSLLSFLFFFPLIAPYSTISCLLMVMLNRTQGIVLKLYNPLLLHSSSPLPSLYIHAGKECLYLSDIFAVIPSPPRSRGPRRLSSSSMESCCEFTIHALRAVPGSPGVLTKLTFRSTKTTSVTDACDIWVQQIKHQLQSE